MCAICGAIAKDGVGDAVDLVLTMLKTMSHRGPDSAGIALDGGEVLTARPAELAAELRGRRSARCIGHARLRITGGDSGLQPFYDPDSEKRLVFNGEIYNYKELLAKYAGEEADTDGIALFRALIDGVDEDGERAVERTLALLDGVYAFAVMDGDSIVLARDRVGVKQLYFGENGDFIAFASERKALWAVGMKSKRLDPGEILKLGSDSVAKTRFHEFSILPVKYREKKRAVDVYRTVLLQAVRKRVEGHAKVGVLFSGGVDSVLIAKIASLFCDEVIGYVGGVPGSPDLKHAISAARAIGLPLRVRELHPDLIEDLVPKTIAAIEDGDLMQVEVAIPMFATLSQAREDGVRVMLTGQGADEIFAGYEWYPPIFRRNGEAALLKCMWSDISNLYRDTLEREDKMCMSHSIELRVPFLDPAVIEESMMISPLLKIDRAGGRGAALHKRLHREVAIELGVPLSIAYRPKDGAQHGSGIHRAVEAIAERRKVLAATRSFEMDEPELRGSAFRHEGIDVSGDAYGSGQARAYIASEALRVFDPVIRVTA